MSTWTSVATAAGAAAIVIAELALKLTLVFKLTLIIGCQNRSC